MTFRSVLFWFHLAAGVVSGLAIGIMCFTGAALAFEKELIAWAERDARRVEAPAAGAPRLALDELQRRFRAAQPAARPGSIVFQNDPHAAVAFTVGRSESYYVNPYTGEVRRPASAAMGRFMQTMIDWHRYLNLTGETTRPRGKLINGICNVAFCLLAVTGLYLWMPRQWSWRALRPVVWFRQNGSAKARDFNWHNTIGFWSAPVLIVLTLTAMPISFRWAGNFLYTLTGDKLPAGSSSTPPAAAVPTPPAGARPLPLDALLAAVQVELPRWKTITLRLGGSISRSGSSSTPAAANPAAVTQPVSFTVREAASWPRTATTTVQVDPFTARVLRSEGYADQSPARRLRSWTRFLHTGEAVGPLGQFVAGLACLGGVFLVYTGFALTWRRFFGQPPSLPPPPTRRRAESAVSS